MQGWRGRVWVAGGLLGLFLTRSAACGGGGGDGADPEVAALLADLGPKVVLPGLDRTGTAAAELATAVDAWAAAPADDAALDAARAAFLATVEAWEPLEMALVGPAASSLDAVGGRDLRDEILSYPTTNACRVDEITVDQSWTSPTFFEDNLITSRGLDALDRLLFGGDADACGEDVDLHADGTWDALGAEEIRARRAAYAAVLAPRLVDDVGRLAAAWDPAGDDFSAQLAAAGEDGSPYTTQDEALQAVFGALFALETSTQDRKLGRVLGLRDCASDACPDDTELPWSASSNRWVAADLRGFRAVFEGGDGSGIDDLLAARGASDVRDQVLAALDAADAAAAALEVPVEQAAVEDPAPALAVHEAVLGVTGLLETDVATVLELRLPTEVAGDND